jgi:hypothetical protein
MEKHESRKSCDTVPLRRSCRKDLANKISPHVCRATKFLLKSDAIIISGDTHTEFSLFQQF